MVVREERKVREHLQILQTIAETEEKKGKTGIFLQIDIGIF